MIRSIVRLLLMILAASIAVVGIFAVAKQFLGWPKGGFKDNLWLLVAGVAAFTLYLLIDEYRKFKRQAGVRELVKKLSFTFSAEGSEEIAERLGKLLAGRLGKLIGTSDRDFELENVIQGVRDGVQILVGDFLADIHDDPSTHEETQANLDAVTFLQRAQGNLSKLSGLEFSGERVTAIKCYLTGENMGGGQFNIRRLHIKDKHGLSRVADNAKVNMYRDSAKPILLGIEDRKLALAVAPA